jgi:hypothetical protein
MSRTFQFRCEMFSAKDSALIGEKECIGSMQDVCNYSFSSSINFLICRSKSDSNS